MSVLYAHNISVIVYDETVFPGTNFTLPLSLLAGTRIHKRKNICVSKHVSFRGNIESNPHIPLKPPHELTVNETSVKSQRNYFLKRGDLEGFCGSLRTCSADAVTD